jgi:NAD(P)-dependent dehydrogenase (short-subunit alcohol dehydrogenase family)
MDTIPPQHGKLAIVTGGNRGLGLEIALALAGSGAQLILACRDLDKAAHAIGQIRARHPRAEVEAMQLDVADLASIRHFSEAFDSRYDRLDLLIHNAAAIMIPQGRTVDGFETHFGTNHLGPFALTGLLLPKLQAAPAARIVNMASLAHRLTAGLDTGDPQLERRAYKSMDAYGRSKLAALLFTFELTRRVKREHSGILAVAAHPGYAATNLDIGGIFLRWSTRLFAQPPARGALPALHAATATDVRSGDYFGPGGFKELSGLPKRVECSAEARDPMAAARLWELSERLTGVRYL